MYKFDRILIIGSSGMLGNTMIQYLSEKKNFKVYGLQRSKSINNKNIEFFIIKKFTREKIFKIIKIIKPKFVINCAGLINHKIKKKNIDDAFFLNSFFPKLLAEGSKIFNFSLIHISTDCVFDGKKGNYIETDVPNAKDIYGISKYLGEIFGKKVITIRTSIFGHERKTRLGLLEWFLNSKNKIKGYKNFFFTGLTTLELSKIIYNYILKNRKIRKGLFHIGGKKISKFKLLKDINHCYMKKIKIIPVSIPKVDKSLKSSKFIKITGYKFTSLKIMINEMKEFNEKFF